MSSTPMVRVKDVGGSSVGTVLLFVGQRRAWARDDRHGLTSWHDDVWSAIDEVRRRAACVQRHEAVCP